MPAEWEVLHKVDSEMRLLKDMGSLSGPCRMLRFPLVELTNINRLACCPIYVLEAPERFKIGHETCERFKIRWNRRGMQYNRQNSASS